MFESPMILPLINPPEAGFRHDAERFVNAATEQCPTRAQASILLAGAGARADQQCLARFAVGMVWLTWHYQPAWAWLNPAIEQCAAHVGSVVYLRIQQQAAVLRHIAVQDRPRPHHQPIPYLLREAEMIIYLTTGRWTQPVTLPSTSRFG